MRDSTSAEEEHCDWRHRRQEHVASVCGNLSLVETRWFPVGTGAADAERAVHREQENAGPGVTVTALSRTNIDSGEPEFGLRVWDANAPALHAFEGIAVFEYDPGWVLSAEFVPVAADRTVPFEHIRDAGGVRDLVVPGDLVFEREGERFALSAFDDDGTLLLVFGDPTNRRSDDLATYGAGRFLSVERDRSGFGTPGRVTLDFNRAFVPPCGFSAQYNCPMPPPQNRLPWPVTAGERLPRFRDGFDPYAQ